MLRKTPTIVITVKNRLEHFLKTFPFNVTQVGIDYRLVYVDYDSEDNFSEHLIKEIENKKDIFSRNLLEIRLVKLNKKARYDIRRAKNLGAYYASRYSSILLISDADTMLGMDYTKKWCSYITPGETFVTNRIQESMAQLPRRIKQEVNYGNIIVATQDFDSVLGYDETNVGWGGDDDDLFHRLKLAGLREINPYSFDDASQYSIMHSDELRFKDTENPNMERPDSAETAKAFKKIYSNKSNILSLKYDYFSPIVQNFSKERVLYEN